MAGTDQIAWETLGPVGAPWLVVSHGMGLSRHDLQAIAEKLSAHWRIFLWDMPGHGDSGPLPPSVSAWSIASTLEALLQKANVTNPVMLGFSFGGVVAQILHRRNPQEVRGLILYGCYSPFVGRPLVPSSLVGPVLTLTMRWRRWPALRDEFARNCGTKAWTQARISQQVDRIGKTGLIAMTRALLRAVEPDPGYRIACPLLLLRGDQDSNGARLADAQDALFQCADLASKILIPNAGHCAHHDAENDFEDAIMQWLELTFPTGV